MVICDISIKSKKWHQQENITEYIEKITEKIIDLIGLEKIVKKKVKLEIIFSLVNNQQIKDINIKYRGKNKPTNVLSFSNLDEKEILKIGINKFFNKILDKQNFLILGDIVLAYETIAKEAKSDSKKFNDHLTHLIVHAILHLIGYDHEQEKMAKIMEDLEIKILHRLGIKNPYDTKLT